MPSFVLLQKDEMANCTQLHLMQFHCHLSYITCAVYPKFHSIPFYYIYKLYMRILSVILSSFATLTTPTINKLSIKFLRKMLEMEECFQSPLMQKNDKWPTQHQARAFYSKTETHPCVVTLWVKATNFPLSHPFNGTGSLIQACTSLHLYCYHGTSSHSLCISSHSGMLLNTQSVADQYSVDKLL